MNLIKRRERQKCLILHIFITLPPAARFLLTVKSNFADKKRGQPTVVYADFGIDVCGFFI